MEARLKNLDYAFNPRSIAFVGATETMNKWGFLVLNNLLTGGYRGEVYPVNPSRQTILGLQAYPSVRDIPGQVDLAVLTVPASKVIGALDDCAAKGVKVGLVITAGFRELGRDGTDLEAELVHRNQNNGMTIIGPNCQGICCPASRLYAWMPILFHPPGGRIGFVSQSGNILNMLIGHAADSGCGVSKGVSSGNEAATKTEDYLSFFSQDADTDVIVSYMEGVNDGRALLRTARTVTRRKPIVMLKGGRTQSGVSAARSHTGAMAVSERLFEAASRQAGITMTRSIEEAGITAASFVNRPLPRGKRVGIVTGGGGLGVIAADSCTEEGLIVPQLSAGTLADLGRYMPDWWVPGNPIDLVAGLDLTIIKPVIETLMKSGEVDSVMFLWVGSPRNEKALDTTRGGVDISGVWKIMRDHYREYSSELYGLMHELQIPLYITSSLSVRDINEDAHQSIDEQFLIYPSVESACRSISSMAAYNDYLQSP